MRGSTMTKREAEILFREHVLPVVKATFEKDGRIDRPARDEAWNDWTDSLCKSGKITLRQYETWGHPR